MTTTPSEIIEIVSSGIQALATIILVYITHRQMRQARESIESMERSTKAGFLPVLMLGYYPADEKTLNIELINCGKGLAIKPRVIFPGKPDIIMNSISVGEKDNATIIYDIEYLLKKVDEKDRKITIEYHDVFRRKIITEANLIEVNNLGPKNDKKGMRWETWTPVIPSN